MVASPNPEPTPEDIAFEQIVCGGGVRRISAWQSAWELAAETLDKVALGGFTPEDIGRHAWDMLPDEEKSEALDALFYAWWSAHADAGVDLARRGGQAGEQA